MDAFWSFFRWLRRVDDDSCCNIISSLEWHDERKPEFLIGFLSSSLSKFYCCLHLQICTIVMCFISRKWDFSLLSFYNIVYGVLCVASKFAIIIWMSSIDWGVDGIAGRSGFNGRTMRILVKDAITVIIAQLMTHRDDDGCVSNTN